MRQSTPDSGLGYPVKPLKTLGVVLASLEHGIHGDVGRSHTRRHASSRSSTRPAESDHIACFNSHDSYRSSPESGDLQCDPGVSKTAICSRFEGCRIGPCDRASLGTESVATHGGILGQPVVLTITCALRPRVRDRNEIGSSSPSNKHPPIARVTALHF